MLQTYETTAGAEEILYQFGTLVALLNDQPGELAEYGPKLNLGDQRRVRLEYQWNQQPRRVVAVDADSGEQHWSHASKVAPLSLAADGDRVFFHDGEKMICLDRASGQQQWETLPIGRRGNNTMTMNFGPRLVVYGDIVLFAGGDRSMRAVDAATGKILWTKTSRPRRLRIARRPAGLGWNGLVSADHTRERFRCLYGTRPDDR